MAIIYKIQNKQNDKVYIGQTKRTLDWRLNNSWCGHFPAAFDKNSGGYLHTALRKYGKEAFTYEIIEERFDFNDKISMTTWLNDREKYWIAYYKSNQHDFGYNKTVGGQTGKPNINCSYHSDKMRAYNKEFWSNEEKVNERRKKVSEQSKLQWQNVEYKEKVIAKQKATNAKKTKEEKHKSAMKAVESRRKHNTLKFSESAKAKLSTSVKNLWKDSAYKEKQSNSKIGNTNVKGRIHVHNEKEHRMIKPEQLEDFLSNGYMLGSGVHSHNFLTEEEKHSRKQRMLERGTLDKLKDVSKATIANKGCKVLYKDGLKKTFKKEDLEYAKSSGWLSFRDYQKSGGTLSWINNGKPVELHKAKFALLYKDGKQKRVKLEDYENAIVSGWLPYKDYLASGGKLSWRFPKRGKKNENKEN